MNMNSVEGFVDLDRLENISAASNEAEERTLSIISGALTISALISEVVSAVTMEVC